MEWEVKSYLESDSWGSYYQWEESEETEQKTCGLHFEIEVRVVLVFMERLIWKNESIYNFLETAQQIVQNVIDVD